MKRERDIRRASRAAIVIVAGAIMVLALGLWSGPEHFWLVALAEYGPYPAYVLPAVVSVGLSLALGWPWRLAALLSLVLVATSIMGLEFPRRASGAVRIRVMTYNVKDYITLHRAGGLADVGEEIARHDPDLLVLQDARELTDLPETNPEAAHFLFGDREIFAFGQYVVASRFPLRECGRRDIPFREEAHTYVSCIVTVNGAELDLVVAHFMTPRFGLAATRRNPFRGIGEWKQNIADRMSQADELARDVRSRVRPTIVAGDFNAPQTSLVVRALLDTGLRDAFSVAGLGYGYTWGHSLRTRFSFLRLDHVLLSPEFGVADCFVGGAAASHRPVIADIFLQSPRSPVAPRRP